MKKSILKEWAEAIRPLFPTDAIIEPKMEEYVGVIVGDTNEIEPYEGGDVIFVIHWKPGNDPSRPNKRSRFIQLRIEEAAINDCLDIAEAGSRLKEIVKTRLSTFDPNVGPPTEEWVISTDDLN